MLCQCLNHDTEKACFTAQDRIGKLEDLAAVLRSKIEGLTVQNAGLRAHNETLLDAESGTGTPDQVGTLHEMLCAICSC